VRDKDVGAVQAARLWFLFRSEMFFRTTHELEYLFFCRAKLKFFFQNLTLDYMTKTLNQIIFFFLHQNQNIFFSHIAPRPSPSTHAEKETCYIQYGSLLLFQ
jgi:hypothetical protein